MSVKNVTITLSNGQLVPSEDPIHLSKEQGQVICWINGTTETINIDFPNGTPFAANENPYVISANGSKKTGAVQASAGTQWTYDISNAAGAFTDPQVIIDK